MTITWKVCLPLTGDNGQFGRFVREQFSILIESDSRILLRTRSLGQGYPDLEWEPCKRANALSKAADSALLTGQFPHPNRPNRSSHAVAISHSSLRDCRFRAGPLSPYRFPNDHRRKRDVIIHEGHDRAAKRIFGDVRTMRDVLRAFVPGDWVADLDLNTLRPLPAEHVGTELRRRRGDLLWMVDLKGGGSVVVVVEAQSSPDTRMGARTMTLTGLICEGFKAEAWGPAGRLPAVLPIVLYTGSPRWTPALDLAERVGPPAELAPYVAGPRYLLLDVRRMGEQDLPKRNLMSTFVRLESAGTFGAMEAVLRETFAWLGEDELAWAFFEWAVRVLIPLNLPDVGWGRGALSRGARGACPSHELKT